MTAKIAAARKMKETGEPNDLISRLESDSRFGITKAELESLIDPIAFTGCAKEQTEDFLATVKAILDENKSEIPTGAEVRV